MFKKIKIFLCLALLLIGNKASAEANYYIFISSSMHQEHIKSIIREGKRLGAVVVLQGLVNDSFLNTQKYFKTIIKDTDGGVTINPPLFKKFNVTRVPCFVLARGDKFDKIGGTMTAEWALNKFQEAGELKEDARQILKRVKK